MDAFRQHMLEKFARRVAAKKIGEFAPGIPARKPKAVIPRVARFGKPVTWWYTDHKHEAVRAGLHCFIAGTPIDMADGSVRSIDQLAVGDAVTTPYGVDYVNRVWYNGPCEDWLEVSSDGREVVCTPNEPFWVRDVGWTPIGLVAGFEAFVEDGFVCVEDKDVQRLRDMLRAALEEGKDLQYGLWREVGAREAREQEKNRPSSASVCASKDADFAMCYLSEAVQERRCSCQDMQPRMQPSSGAPDDSFSRRFCCGGFTEKEVSECEESARQESLQEVAYSVGSRLVVAEVCLGGVQPGRCRSDGRVFSDYNKFGPEETEHTYTRWEGEDIEGYIEGIWPEQLALEGRHLQRSRSRHHAAWIAVEDAKASPICGERDGLRVVRRAVSQETACNSSHHSFQSCAGSFRRPSCDSVQELPHEGRYFIQENGRRFLRIRQLPRVSRGRFDIEVRNSHCYYANGFLVHNSDLRLSDGYKAYSWAVRKGMPKIPGEKVLAIRQPDHKPSYMSFEGQISSGYGKTKGRGVWVAEQGPARIIQANPQKIRFTLIKSQNPRQYTMIHQGGDKWLLINTTPTPETRPGVPQSKPKYKEESPETFRASLREGLRKVVMAKIDGAHVSVNFDRESPEIYSHRPSERKSGLIDHTYLAGLERVRTPKALRGVRVRGEIHAVDKKGRSIPNRELAGIINSSPMRGRNTLDAKNLELRIGVFDAISAPGGRDVTATPWGEKHKVLKQVARSMKGHGFKIPETAFTPAQQRRLFNRIQSGEHPESGEGVVEWDLDQAGPPTKRKFRPHRQVFVHTVYRGEGETNKGTMGRYSYSLTPNGPPVGFVGTGFGRVQSDWMWKNRHSIQGRKVVIKSSEQFPSGAYRAPSHSHLHL